MIRKALAIIVFALVTLQSMSQCLMYELPLAERTSNSNIIIEGKVIAKTPFWNASQDLIYTANEVEILQVFKGNIVASKIEVITEGGRIGTDWHTVKPSLQLNVGQAGVFFLTPTTVVTNQISPYQRFDAYGSSQGFIHYDPIGKIGIDPFNTYPDLFADIYTPLANLTAFNLNNVVPYNFNNANNNVKGGPNAMALPTFTSIVPGTTTAGTYSTITINGNNFGASYTGSANLEYPDANNGGAGWINCPASHIISWSNTQVQAWVVTRAGSGSVRLTNTTNETSISPMTIQVDYNESNVSVAGNYYQPDLIDDNATGGYTYQYHTAFNGSPGQAPFERALETWRCGTYVNFEVNGTTGINCQANDGSNVVMYDGGCALPAGVLGVSYSYYQACAGNNWYLPENDLKFRTDGTGGINWNWGPVATAGGLYDFESVCVHEIGHSHQLGHTVLAPPSVMHWAIGPNTDRRTLQPASELAGGNDIMARSVIANACGPGPMVALTPANCPMAAPAANFSGTPTTGCNSLVVNFTDLSTGTPTAWSWTFTGGVPATSNVQNPVGITWAAPGTYDVSLTVTNAFGVDTETKIGYIVVNNCPPPVADFVATDTIVCAGQCIAFSDLSTNSPTAWSWSFPGGTPATSNVQNPFNICYNTPGVYDVSLTATNAYGNDVELRVGHITVNNCPPPPNASFSAAPTVICSGNTVTFTDLSTGSPTGWSWSFPGGTPGGYNGQNPPPITYNTPGSYDVTLTVINATGTDVITLPNYITVNVCGPPVANFAGVPTTICVGSTVDFFDLSTNAPTSWSWTFTGGVPAASVAQNPTGIAWAAIGTYAVSLTATNAFGNNTNTQINYINVVGCPTFSSGLIVNAGAEVFVQPAADIWVQGGVLTRDTVDINGLHVGTWDSYGYINVTGDWTNNSILNCFINSSPGELEMSGGPEGIRGTTPTHFYDLTLTGTGVKRQYVNARVEGTLDLTDRELATDSFHMFVDNTSSTAIQRTGALNSTPVQGFISSLDTGKVWWTTSGTGTYTFPLGSTEPPARFRPAEVRPTTAPSQQIGMRFVNHDPTIDGFDKTLHDFTLGQINDLWYHKILRNTTLGTDSIDVTIYFDFAADNIIDIDSLKMGEWYWKPPPQVPIRWNDMGDTLIRVQNASPVLSHITRPNWWTFDTENFALAIMSNPLDVELIEFKGVCNQSTAYLSWTTASETDNDYFTVEKSIDGITWEQLAIVNATGNSSSQVSYSAIDYSPYGTTYYRLKQTDNSGFTSYFESIIVSCSGNSIALVNLNPYNEGYVSFDIISSLDENFVVTLFDALGKLIIAKEIQVKEGITSVKLPTGSLAHGIYLLNMNGEYNQLSHKLMTHGW